ncbi:MAG TPA: GtrA family protein [Rhodocyclaceae bacterium]|nr:GtrA family protein [Rhodocyclaceae bacterium]
MTITPIMRQFVQYTLVGGFAFAVDFTALFLLTEKFELHYLVSASIAFLVGLVANYLVCVVWIFDYRALQNKAHEFAVFSLIGLVGLLLNNFLMSTFTELLGLHYLLSKAGAAALILFFNFFFRRLLLFSERKRARLEAL